MQTHYPGHTIQAKPVAFYIVYIAGGHTKEFFKNPAQIFRRDAPALIAHLQGQLSV